MLCRLKYCIHSLRCMQARRILQAESRELPRPENAFQNSWRTHATGLFDLHLKDVQIEQWIFHFQWLNGDTAVRLLCSTEYSIFVHDLGRRIANYNYMLWRHHHWSMLTKTTFWAQLSYVIHLATHLRLWSYFIYLFMTVRWRSQIPISFLTGLTATCVHVMNVVLFEFNDSFKPKTLTDCMINSHHAVGS